ncbi:MAG: AraC family transcriptional regulator [Firmicutes bacterium]|jgi:AraC family transcriptional regulator|nr:AraC family transcriptional regulator [Bacillota bacterium]
MDWIKAVSKSIDFIEDNLTEDISIKDIAKIACISPFYYQRMFSVLTNMSVHSYIRNRRLTLAAMELQNTDIKIIDLAMKYGYDSPEAFSRAFKKAHGVNPSVLRKENTAIKAFMKLTIQVTLKGELPMKYSIETKPAFSFYGMTRTVSTIDEANFRDIPLFWQETMNDGTFMKMIEATGTEKSIGACMPMDPDKDTEFDYVIGGFCDKEIGDYDNYNVPEHKWAVFQVNGPVMKVLQDTWRRIFAEWFPQTGYKHAAEPELEVYFPGDVNSEDYYMEIWIPIE